MIRHILRLVWNRRAGNVLILVEILVSFLVVFAVIAFGVFFWRNARKPMGYQAENASYLRLFAHSGGDDSEEELSHRRSIEKAVAQELASMDRVESVAVIQPPPYMGSTNSSTWKLGDRDLRSELIWADASTREAYGMDLVEGRWFEPGDDEFGWDPVIINRRLAEEAFGDGEALGQILQEADPEARFEEQTEWKVIGVVSDYRKAGEFSAPKNMTFLYLEPGSEDRRLSTLGFRLQPGSTAQYEERILNRLQALAPEWSFKVTALEDARADYRRARLMALALAATVAGSLLLMVGLGLVGVLWQTVTQRTQEIGVRRAKGSPAMKIHVQILGELLAVTLIAILFGFLVLVQLPLTGWFDFLTSEITIPAFFLAAAAMIALALVSGLYPSWLATRVRPAEALHYE